MYYNENENENENENRSIKNYEDHQLEQWSWLSFFRGNSIRYIFGH